MTLDYAVCGTVRCGSTYLLLMMEANKLGRPDEYASPWKYKGPSDAQSRIEYLNSLRAEPRRIGRNGIFGLKMFPENHQLWDDVFKPDRIIYLRRHALLTQAMSRYHARYTEQYVRFKGQPRAEVQFDKAGILTALEQLKQNAEYWEYKFKKFKGPLMRLWYEDLCADPRGTIHKIASFLDVDLPLDQITTDVPIVIQRDETVVQDWFKQLGMAEQWID